MTLFAISFHLTVIAELLSQPWLAFVILEQGRATEKNPSLLPRPEPAIPQTSSAVPGDYSESGCPSVPWSVQSGRRCKDRCPFHIVTLQASSWSAQNLPPAAAALFLLKGFAPPPGNLPPVETR